MFLYFLHTINKSNFELFLDLVIDVHNSYLIFEGVEY